MNGRKQQLLKRHRRNKRIALLVALLALLLVGVFVAWWLPLLLVGLGWVAHEAWFADHLFYSPRDDYRYGFPDDCLSVPVRIEQGMLRVDSDLEGYDTQLLELRLKATWLGRWLDPQVLLGNDRQDFERGVSGRRYLNLSGLRADGLRIVPRFCRIDGEVRLHVMRNPDFAAQRMLIIAPHADDAELAAFGQYSRSSETAIVTLTQGEIEAERYQRLGLDKAAAARLKGRLRAWDSLAAPLWGGVPQQCCVQLGYYCLQLPVMAEQPQVPFGSRESGESDVRPVRRHNPLPLPADTDGQPTWNNLIADLVAVIEHYRPEVLLTPHPELDPHHDHVASTRAVLEACERSGWKPKTLLLYANHLHDNDRWPMGPAGNGIALPPAINALPADRLWSPTLDAERQLDKAIALSLQHDLQGPLPLKRRLRRLIQWALAGRRWPATGEDEFFRKAVRRHELFWVRPL
ncbi:PIG-L deacetylase family protein [Ectopseudomonas oleovorans]|uniref:PIG-L deacetylase family protein n=1 Tax=Ectopseudomonas oleovorans TaxID=301 RepID=UPI0019D31CA6|nr:PIG-L family deacetylase [Pseudomonas oleovorans]MBN7118552.1 GlcNAc-PI de-N-acetylase [Pseudomonas oleovorans]MBN7134539.1 GlcNAc-PI de-N-acetylase [Pseudomonas oleovorans]MBN7140046.1 GlcNAc-PI de-N-acetylase [Pseudomonas oleovorans]